MKRLIIVNNYRESRACGRNTQAVSGGAAARAVVDDAKAAVADTYGIFVGFTDEDDEDLDQSQLAVNGDHPTPEVEEKGYSTGGIRVAV